MLLNAYLSGVDSVKYLRQFTIIFAAALLGELCRRVIPLPVPASVYGLVLLFLALYFGLVKVEQVKDAADFFIDIMPLMFVTPAIAILAHFDSLRPIIIQFTAVTILTTVLVLGVTGLTTQFVIRLRKRGGRND